MARVVMADGVAVRFLHRGLSRGGNAVQVHQKDADGHDYGLTAADSA